MAAAFQLNARHPVLDFVNTLDDRFVAKGPLELLPRYADLLQFATESGLIEPALREALLARQESRAARDALRSAWKLREALADLFYWNAAAGTERINPALATLDRYFAQAAEHRHLAIAGAPSSEADDTEPPRFTLHWGASAERCDLPVWILAEQAHELLLSPDMAHVRMCQSSACKWLFMDASKNHSRRWCDMKVCGNRMKARRYHSRHAGND